MVYDLRGLSSSDQVSLLVDHFDNITPTITDLKNLNSGDFTISLEPINATRRENKAQPATRQLSHAAPDGIRTSPQIDCGLTLAHPTPFN
jgi:hypothetical protein